MNLLLGALTVGFILSLLALGVYISFRIFDFPDITTDGSITLGAAVAATLLVHQVNPLLATLAGALAGALAGTITGILHTRFKIHGLLSGILVMTALYSINLRVMGRSNVPLLNETTLVTYAKQAGEWIAGGKTTLSISMWQIAVRDLAVVLGTFFIILALGILLYNFFRTHIGSAMRATGDNAQMIRALGANTNRMIIAGLALANGLIGLAGALLAQYQGFADVQMGIGMVVWGLASVIIGEALVRTRHLGLTITGAVMGSVLFRLIVAIALRWGLNPNDLKLITALFVFIALILPGMMDKLHAKKGIPQRA